MGNSLVIQWLEFQAPRVGGTNSIPDWGTKIPHAPWHNRIKRGSWTHEGCLQELQKRFRGSGSSKNLCKMHVNIYGAGDPLCLKLPKDSVIPKLSGDPGEGVSIPGLGRFPRSRTWQSHHYSCLETPMHRASCQATVHGVTKSQTQLSVHVITINKIKNY